MERILPSLILAPSAKPIPGDAAELQLLARGLATGEVPWTAELLETIVTLFDTLASRWNAEESTNRFDPVQDALARGEVGAGTCVELGSGTGQITPLLASRFAHVVCVDVSMEMLRQAVTERAPGMPVRADGSRLPLPDQAVQVIVAVDTFLFADEVARVLAPEGCLVWVNLLGTDGPLYVQADVVVSALPGAWEAVSSEAGWGCWSVVRRRAQLD